MNDPARSPTPGDEGFDEFFRRQYRLLIAFLITVGATRELAEDAAAEAMTDLYVHWDRIQAPAAWVRKAARHAFLKLEKRNREQLNRWVQASPHPVENAASPEELTDERATIVHALAQLPARQRHVMAWLVQGFTHADVAKALGLKEATVRSTARHARQRLKEFISEDMNSDFATKNSHAE